MKTILAMLREPRREAGAAAAAVAAILVTAASPVAGDQSQVAAGRELFSLHCASCHGAQLQGSPDAPPLIGVGAAKLDFWVGTGRMPSAYPHVEQVQKPPLLTQQQIKALVAYVTSKSRGGLPIPRVDNAGNLQLGRTLFSANCAACHGATAKGGSVGYGWNAPSLDNASATHVAEAIRIGPGEMPAFNENMLSDQDVDAIVHYVKELRTAPVNPGGVSLSGGPVTEGLVGWLFGLGLLVIVIRLIGTKS